MSERIFNSLWYSKEYFTWQNIYFKERPLFLKFSDAYENELVNHMMKKLLKRQKVQKKIRFDRYIEKDVWKNNYCNTEMENHKIQGKQNNERSGFYAGNILRTTGYK